MANKYTISICRKSFKDFVVEAENVTEAENKAMEEASNTNWAGEDADYDILNSHKE